MMDKTEQAIKVKQRYEKTWLGQKGVVAVGIGKVGNSIGIVVSVENSTDLETIQIPDTVEGIPTRLQVTGPFKSL